MQALHAWGLGPRLSRAQNDDGGVVAGFPKELIPQASLWGSF